METKNYKMYHGYMISKELHEWILKNIPKGSTILELGSGDGTDILSRDYKMISVENNPNYMNKYASHYVNAPLKDGWYDVEILKNELLSLPHKYNLIYDVILVDAPAAFQPDARMGFYHNINLFDTSVPIIIDDTNRHHEKLLADSLAKHLDKEYIEIHSKDKSFCVFNV